MSLRRSHDRKVRFDAPRPVTHRFVDYYAIPVADGEFAVQALESGHIFPDTFASKSAAEDWIGERFYGELPTGKRLRAFAVRCRVACAPAVFGQVYTAVSYEPKGFFDKLSVYIPNAAGVLFAQPMDAAIFDPVLDEHKPRFRHHAVAGFEPVGSAVLRLLDQFGQGAIKSGRQLMGDA